MAKEIRNTEVKVGLIGAASVGKTCIVIRMVEDRFEDKALFTPQFSYHKLKDKTFNGQKFDITFIDTAGTEKYRSMNWAGLQDAQLLLYVYDVTNPTSHEEIASFLTDAEKQRIDPNIPKILIGNKSDLGIHSELVDNNTYEGRFIKTILFSAKQGNGRENIIKDILQYSAQSQNTSQEPLRNKNGGCC